MEQAAFWICRRRRLAFGVRPRIMGVLNVTPDSFSDGGEFVDRTLAVAHALQMVADGADIIDIGGESTRPGAGPVDGEEEAARVVPAIEALRSRSDVFISVDTSKADVAERALAAGADIVNDVSALTHDPDMVRVVGAYAAGAVLMHMQGSPRTMQDLPSYRDVVAEVGSFLRDRVRALASAGLDEGTLAVDPGIGFGKTVEHNLALLANLDELRAESRPLVVGLSRKSFLGKLTGREVSERMAASVAGLAVCVAQGADVMRVHDVRESRDAVVVASEIARHRRGNRAQRSGDRPCRPG
jgi:dihydropteroate synthase